MASVRIATWNINSVRIRLEIIARLTAERRPDVLCLQEIKVEDDGFPADALRRLGYEHQVDSGLKAYHGLAILSRLPQIGRAHVGTPVTNAHLVSRLLLEKKKT